MSAKDHPLYDEVVEFGYTWGQLHEAFNTVADSENWKNPIRAWVYEHNLAIVETAITFFTGSVAMVRRRDRALGMVLVEAAGYYNAIGV